jgi:hypothetical protein
MPKVACLVEAIDAFVLFAEDLTTVSFLFADQLPTLPFLSQRIECSLSNILRRSHLRVVLPLHN